MGQPVVHWELWSKDPGKCSEFYSKVFDWKVSPVPGMDYRLVETGGSGGINGGIMQPKEGPWPGNMAFYISVDDLAPYRDKIAKAGGRVIVEEQKVPGIGAFCLFSDTDGRVLGIWKQEAQQG